jgi:hypothetical protein
MSYDTDNVNAASNHFGQADSLPELGSLEAILKVLEQPDAWQRIIANGLKCEPVVKEELGKLEDINASLAEAELSGNTMSYPDAWGAYIMESLGLTLNKAGDSLEAVASQWLSDCVADVDWPSDEKQEEVAGYE